MLRALAISALAVLALTACQETETSLDQHAPSAPVEEAKIAPPPAQAELTNARGFMTANPVAPNSASLEARTFATVARMSAISLVMAPPSPSMSLRMTRSIAWPAA